MMKAKRTILLYATGLCVLLAAASGWAQDSPTPVPFSSGCMQEDVDSGDNLISNGSFTEGLPVEGAAPDTGWTAGTNSAVLGMQTENTTEGEVDNYYLEFSTPGASISTVPRSDNSTRYTLTFCTVIPAGGMLQIYVGGVLVANVPSVSGSDFNGQFKKDNLIISNSVGSSQSEKTIEIVYTGDSSVGPAYVDNVQLIASSNTGGDDATPTPTVAEPTPTAAPDGPSPTPTPTIQPGIPTPTPTPAITTQSVQMTANPPLLMVTPDDFVSTMSGGARKQVSLDLQVVGSTGEKIDILGIDPDATIRFIVDTRGDAEGVGSVQGYNVENRDWYSLNNQRIDLSRFKNTYQERAFFIPAKPYTGTVRVIVEIEYDGWANGKEQTHKIRGVVPIVVQTDKSSSLTNVTGTFDPVQNLNLGKKPGDRGFRPDVRTNLYFRERMQ